MTAAFAILAAVLCARRTGKGERIDVSIADLVVAWTAPMGPIAAPQPATPVNPGMGVYRTAEGGYLVLGVHTEDKFWAALCQLLDMAEHGGLTYSERLGRGEELLAELQARMSGRTRTELLAALSAAGVPAAPVLSRMEALEHPHFHARGTFTEGPSGERRLAHPVIYRNHPARPPGPPPGLGAKGERGFDDA